MKVQAPVFCMNTGVFRSLVEGGCSMSGPLRLSSSGRTEDDQPPARVMNHGRILVIRGSEGFTQTFGYTALLSDPY